MVVAEKRLSVEDYWAPPGRGLRSSRSAGPDDRAVEICTLRPDLAVESVSPCETASAVHDRVRQHLGAGVRRVWLVYPSRREAVVFYPGGSAQTYGSEDALDGGAVLRGLVLPLARIFPPQAV